MSQKAEVYDLGDVEPTLQRNEQRHETIRRAAMTPGRAAVGDSPRPVSLGVRSLSLFVPGASQVALGRRSLGLCFMSLLGFAGALTWAVLETMDRLASTLGYLGQSVGLAFWTLIFAFLLAVGVHLGAVWNAGRPVGPAVHVPDHPAVPAVASALVPGWGQLLNANRVRALLFLAACWLAGGAWLATSGPVTELIDAYVPGVGSWEQALRTPELLWGAKWTLPAVVWALSVYDAACSVIARR